jgi:hypothetical protein
MKHLWGVIAKKSSFPNLDMYKLGTMTTPPANVAGCASSSRSRCLKEWCLQQQHQQPWQHYQWLLLPMFSLQRLWQGPGLGETLSIIIAKIVMLFCCMLNFIFIQPSNHWFLNERNGLTCHSSSHNQQFEHQNGASDGNTIWYMSLSQQ